MQDLELYSIEKARELTAGISRNTTLGLNEAAALMRVHPDTARKLVKAGLGPPACKVGREWVFPAHRLLEWIDRQCHSTGDKAAGIGGYVSRSAASRLASRRERVIAARQKNLNI
jgi:Helix-turn-helix domain